jgi:hypothetical protein
MPSFITATVPEQAEWQDILKAVVEWFAHLHILGGPRFDC